MSRQRPCLVHGARRSNKVHQLGPSAVSSDEQSAADDLAQDGQVRLHAVKLLRPTRCNAEARDHLVEDQQRTIPLGQLAKPREEPAERRNHSHVGRDRFDDHGGDLAGMRLEQRLDGSQVVVDRDQRLRRHRLRHAGAARYRERRRARTRLDQQRVGVPVISALELDDELPPCRRPRDTKGAHRRLSPAVDEPQSLDGRHPGSDHLGQADLARACHAKRATHDGRRRDRLRDRGVSVTEHKRAEGADVVDVPPAWLVPDVGTLAAEQ